MPRWVGSRAQKQQGTHAAASRSLEDALPVESEAESKGVVGSLSRVSERMERGMAEEALKAGVRRGSTDEMIDAAYAGASVVDTRMKVGSGWFSTGPPLCSASAAGNIRMCKLLLLLGADVAAGNTDYNVQPLGLAASRGHSEVVTLLLDRGADIDATSTLGETALMKAAYERHPAVVTLLLDRGASIHPTHMSGQTAFDFAQRGGGAATFGPELMARLNPRSPASIAAANADAAEAKSTAAVEAQRALVAVAPQLGLDTFTITKRIGERSRPTAFLQFYGVNSAVFEAVLDGQLVVIKVVFNVEQVTDSNLSKTFKPDYAVIEDASKSHPNVVAGLGHFVGEASRRALGEAWDANPEYVRLNTLFVVMEPMEKPLRKLISDLAGARGAEGGADAAAPSAWPPVLPMPVFKVVIQRVLRGVLNLFRHGIVHRDLKADNVLITYTPTARNDGVSQPTVLVKLADFGHALDTAAEECIENFKMPYLVRGQPKGGAAAYLAPEVVTAEPGTLQNITFIDYSKNDVFAAGMLAHYMLTNGVEDAFATRDPEYTAVHHPHYSAATYNHPPRGCPPPIADLVWAMVNPSFEHRITAEEALARVDALIEGPRLEWGPAD